MNRTERLAAAKAAAKRMAKKLGVAPEELIAPATIKALDMVIPKSVKDPKRYLSRSLSRYLSQVVAADRSPVTAASHNEQKAAWAVQTSALTDSGELPGQVAPGHRIASGIELDQDEILDLRGAINRLSPYDQSIVLHILSGESGAPKGLSLGFWPDEQARVATLLRKLMELE